MQRKMQEMEKPLFCPLVSGNCYKGDCAMFVNDKCVFRDLVDVISETKDSIATVAKKIGQLNKESDQ